MIKLKKSWLTLLTLVVGGGLILIYEQIRTLTPETILTNVFNMDAPARFAFISDQETPYLAVVDILQNAQIGTLTLQMPAKTLAVAKNKPLLVYSDGGNRWISHHLVTHKEDHHSTLYPVEELKFLDKKLLLLGKQALTVLDIESVNHKKIMEFSDFGQIAGEIYSPLAQTLWIIDAGLRDSSSEGADFISKNQCSGGAEKTEPCSFRSPSLWRYNFYDQSIKRFALPNDWHHFSPAAMSPDGRFILLGAQNQDGLFMLAIFSTATGELIEQKLLSAPLVQPYIDQASQQFFALDQQGLGFIFTPSDVKTVEKREKIVDFSQNVTHYATIWLDRRLLVLGTKLQLYNLSRGEIEMSLSLIKNPQALFISGDSKIALIGMASAELNIFDGKAQILRKAKLTGINAARVIVMGASNTLCH